MLLDKLTSNGPTCSNKLYELSSYWSIFQPLNAYSSVFLQF